MVRENSHNHISKREHKEVRMSFTYDVKNTDVDKFKMSDVMNVYRIINL